MDPKIRQSLKAAETELVTDEQREDQLRTELQTLVFEKVSREVEGLKPDKTADKRIAALRSEVQEAGTILKARTARVKELRRLATSEEVAAANKTRREIVKAAVAVAERIEPLLRQIQECRDRILELANQEQAFIHRTNSDLGLHGVDALQTVLQYNVGQMLAPPYNIELFAERAAKARANFLNW